MQHNPMRLDMGRAPEINKGANEAMLPVAVAAMGMVRDQNEDAGPLLQVSVVGAVMPGSVRLRAAVRGCETLSMRCASS